MHHRRRWRRSRNSTIFLIYFLFLVSSPAFQNPASFLSPMQQQHARLPGWSPRASNLGRDPARVARSKPSPPPNSPPPVTAACSAPTVGDALLLEPFLPAADAPSETEAMRAAPAVSSLVGEFHDRFWLPRGETGDMAAASAASIAAISPDPGQRSVAAHLYAVRVAQRLTSQVGHVVRHRAPKPVPPELRGADFHAELESAIGAAVHAELCRVFDEVGALYLLMRDQHATIGSGGGGCGGRGGHHGAHAPPPTRLPRGYSRPDAHLLGGSNATSCTTSRAGSRAGTPQPPPAPSGRAAPLSRVLGGAGLEGSVPGVPAAPPTSPSMLSGRYECSSGGGHGYGGGGGGGGGSSYGGGGGSGSLLQQQRLDAARAEVLALQAQVRALERALHEAIATQAGGRRAGA